VGFLHYSTTSACLQPHESDAALAALADAPLDVLEVFRSRFQPPRGFCFYRITRGTSTLIAARQRAPRCDNGGNGGTLLHAVCINPNSNEAQIRIVVDVLRVSPFHLDDALRSPIDLLRLRRNQPLSFSLIIEELEERERDELAADPRHGLTLALARRRGLPDDVGERIARFLRVASTTTA
jgi:hypothetical protein